MTLMLASVLSSAEAETAVACGADIIDCKDARRGALGALPLDEVAKIVALVAKRRPVSTVVELPHDVSQARAAIQAAAATGVDFVKFALPMTPDLREVVDALAPLCPKIRLVAVLFADLSPDLDVLPLLARAGFHGVMLDTAHKGKGRLLDYVGVGALGDFVSRGRALGLSCGLAGSLEAPDAPRRAPKRAFGRGSDADARDDPAPACAGAALWRGRPRLRAQSCHAGGDRRLWPRARP